MMRKRQHMKAFGKVPPRWHSGKESSCQCRSHKRHWFDPWVGKIPWRREWQPVLVFWPGKFHGQRSVVGYWPGVCKRVRHWVTEHELLLLLSRLSRVRPCATPQTEAHQAPPSLGFSRQEHWSGVPLPSPTHKTKLYINKNWLLLCWLMESNMKKSDKFFKEH